MKEPNIAYPFARDTDGSPVPIGDAERGAPYTCVGCGGAMIPKLGSVKRYHFAHKHNETCDADNALHESAKIHIIRKFDKAAQTGGDCIIPAPCSCCGQTINHNLTAGGVKIRPEITVVGGTRSDLAILREDSSAYTIIEVVVTHDLEANTREAYLKSGIPVAVTKPSWDDMDTIRGTLNVKCERCMVRERDLGSFMAGIAGNGAALREITQDQYGAQLFPRIRHVVNAHARALRDFGFVQQNSRPTLFLHETDHWKVYADLDSTRVMRIWEVGGEAAVYAFVKDGRAEEDCRPDCKYCVEKTTRERLRAAGVPIRRYVPDTGHHWHGIGHGRV